MTPPISIVILNWNGWPDTIECLESLYQINYPNYDVIVLDNHSKDDSLEKIREYCEGKQITYSNFFEYEDTNKPLKIYEITKEESDNFQGNEGCFNELPSNKKLTLIKNKRNDGYAEGNNIGMSYAMKNNPQYVLLLNNDTVVTKDFLKELINTVENQENVGIVGPKIYYYHQPNVINSAGGKILWNLGTGINLGMGEEDNEHYSNISECEYLMGACILIKTSLIKEIGFLDKKFFLLLEDTEYCVRAKNAGYNILFVPSSTVYHKEGISGKQDALNVYYFNRNRLLLVRKHQNGYKKVAYIIYISLRVFTALIIYLIKIEGVNVKSAFKGWKDGLTETN